MAAPSSQGSSANTASPVRTSPLSSRKLQPRRGGTASAGSAIGTRRGVSASTSTGGRGRLKAASAIRASVAPTLSGPSIASPSARSSAARSSGASSRH